LTIVQVLNIDDVLPDNNCKFLSNNNKLIFIIVMVAIIALVGPASGYELPLDHFRSQKILVTWDVI